MKHQARIYGLIARAFDRANVVLEWLADKCSAVAYHARERQWWAQMPGNVKIGELGLPNYCCPFCGADLDYRIDDNGISNGVCWPCERTWYETWDNCDCPDFANTNWPTQANVLPWGPSVFWDKTLYHMFQRGADGLLHDTGKATPVNFSDYE